MKVAMIGHKVVPSRRGGIENVLTTLCPMLVEMGLDVPKITRVFISLQEKGYPVSRNVYTVEQGKQELMRLLGKGGDSNA